MSVSNLHGAAVPENSNLGMIILSTENYKSPAPEGLDEA
jgi:hypothetical protein